MQWKASIRRISAVSLVLAVVLALPGVGCSRIHSSANNTGPSNVPTGMSLTISEPQDNTITDVATVVVKGQTDPGAVVSVNEVMTSADTNGNF
ncbi:MAG TPA: hypothetical protein VEG43_00355, partial [Dehalococcoidia bacterium]|nr:hypothetical protein [Dehalococcoidia bacterium]